MEIEAKFSLADEGKVQELRLADSLAGFALAEGKVKQVHDTYLDTTGRVIMAAGYACRLREQGKETLIALKSLKGAEGPIHRREEMEVSLPSYCPPAEWPDCPARELVLSLIDESDLAPLFELRQTRLVRPVSRGETPVAEMSLDEVHLASGDRERAFFELEVELKAEGTENELETLATCLQDEWGLKPEPSSKFERALAFLQETGGLLTGQERDACRHIAGLGNRYSKRALALLAVDEGASQAQAGESAGLSERRVRYWLSEFRNRRLGIFSAALPESEQPPQPGQPVSPEQEAGPKPPSKEPGLEAADTMSEAAHKTLRLHFQHMLYHEPGTRSGEDIEELHHMRVATRRMRAALRLFSDYLDAEKMAPILKGLRRTGGALGAVRDLDVFWEKTQGYLDSLPPEQPVDLEPLRKVWEEQREASREQMLAYLDGDRYARFKEQLGEYLQSPPPAPDSLWAKGEPVPQRLRQIVPLTVYQRLAVVLAYKDWLGPDVPVERLHQLRITAKRLRYTLEFFQEILGPEAKTLVEETKKLQDHLGGLQDAVVASNLLRDFLTWGTWGPGQAEGKRPWPTEPVIAPGVAAYLAVRQAELQRLLNTFPQIWERFTGPELTRLAASAMAAL